MSTPSREKSDEEKYWDQYRHPLNLRLHSRVHAIKFLNLSSKSFLCASSNKLECYESRNGESVAYFFKEKVTCCDIRKDDSMFVGGDEKGYVRIFGAKQKKPLRMIKAHDLTVTNVKFSDNKRSLITCSTDFKAKIFDIATSENKFSYDQFKDKATCLDVKGNSNDENCFICGSYDKTVRIFDTREPTPVVSTIDHGEGVDTVKTFANGTLFASGGGRIVKIWDMRKNTEPIKMLADHHKHIMDLSVNSDETRILSAGIDRLVKIYSTGSFECLHTLTYPAPILTFDVAKDDKYLAVGMSDETVSVKIKVEQQSVEDKIVPIFSERKRKVLEKAEFHIVNDKAQIKHHKKDRENKTEVFLRQFKHTESLKAGIQSLRGKKSEEFYALLFELERRDVLDTCLTGIGLTDMTALLRFIHESLGNPTMFDLSVTIYEKILTLHGGNIDFVNNQDVNKILKSSLQKVKNRLKLSRDMTTFASQLEMLESAMFNYYQDDLPKSFELKSDDKLDEKL